MRTNPSAKKTEPNSLEETDGRPFRLAGRELTRRDHCHVCAFFSSPDEEYRILLPFIREGLCAGERVIHVVDPERHEDQTRRLHSDGIDFEDLTAAGQLDMRLWTETHLVDGEFDATDTLSRFKNIARYSAENGFSLMRFITQMEWALETMSSPDALLEYEALANYAWLNQQGPVNPVICTYDLRKFSGAVVIDVMRTHPLIIIGGAIQENPFYVSPDELLREISSRRNGTALPSR